MSHSSGKEMTSTRAHYPPIHMRQLLILIGFFSLVFLVNAYFSWRTSEGRVLYMHVMDSGFDDYIKKATKADWKFMRSHYYRAIVWESGFHKYASKRYFNKGWEQRNLLAIYNEDHPSISIENDKSRYFKNEPNYFLYLSGQQTRKNATYIPYDCNRNCNRNGRNYICCSQWSADPGDSGWRKKFIDEQRSTLAKGDYAGTYIDDVNIHRINVSSPDGTGTIVEPFDVRTKTKMTFDDWVSYHADFLVAIKNQLQREVTVQQFSF